MFSLRLCRLDYLLGHHTRELDNHSLVFPGSDDEELGFWMLVCPHPSYAPKEILDVMEPGFPSPQALTFVSSMECP